MDPTLAFPLLLGLIGVALFFDFLNGLHDAANSIATIVSTRVLRPQYAVFWAAFFNFIAFLFFGLHVAETIGKGIVSADIVTPQVVFAALVGAISWNIITWLYGIPSSSSHALIGGLVGGAVAKAGSVTVTDSYTVEFYSHVMHIVSNVVGRLDPAHDGVDALLAGFPAGTVSGAPKVRACQIIAELEPEKRGAYAGGVGYFAPDGTLDSCIVLRTGVVKDGILHVQAGAGIVADSNPEYELNECYAKAGALIAAAREAARIAREPGFGQ